MNMTARHQQEPSGKPDRRNAGVATVTMATRQKDCLPPLSALLCSGLVSVYQLFPSSCHFL